MNKPIDKHECNVLVIGVGIAGLVAARYLHTQDIPVIAVDKEERVGGRIVTEHLGGGWADTGAQFFTVRDLFFQTYVDKWLEEGLIYKWSSGWPSTLSSEAVDDGYPRYAAYDGLNAICRQLAQNLPVHKSTEIVSISQGPDGWTAVTQRGEIYNSTAVIMTPPVPISLSLLAAGEVKLTDSDRAALEKIVYAPAITGIILLDGKTSLPEPGALQKPTSRIGWISDNWQKGISPQATTITLHVSTEMSQLWWLAPDAELKGALRREVQPFLAPETSILDIQIRRWPYALPTTMHPERTLLAEDLPPLAFAGDAFNGPRVEGAALSGLAAAKMIENQSC